MPPSSHPNPSEKIVVAPQPAPMPSSAPSFGKLPTTSHGITCAVATRPNAPAFVQVKRKLLNEFNVWAIVSLPAGVFTSAGAGVKTNLFFFTKGEQTESIWYYDISDIKANKKNPFTINLLEDFFRLLPERADSERSWTVTRAEIEAKNYDLKAVNPNAKQDTDMRTPEELLDLIEAKGREIAEALVVLRGK